MTEKEKTEIIYSFLQFCKKVLKLKSTPKVTLIGDRSWVINRFSFGEYDKNNESIIVYIKNRNLADVLRTLAHEMVHHKQNEKGQIKNNSGKTGSDIENEANSIAGIIMRDYGKRNPIVYESTQKIK